MSAPPGPAIALPVAPPSIARCPDAGLGRIVGALAWSGAIPTGIDAWKTKLAGYPRVSPLRPAPVSSLGDWMVCLTNDQDGDPPVYAVFIRNSAVVDTRLAVVIDACANDTFAPLPSR